MRDTLLTLHTHIRSYWINKFAVPRSINNKTQERELKVGHDDTIQFYLMHYWNYFETTLANCVLFTRIWRFIGYPASKQETKISLESSLFCVIMV